MRIAFTALCAILLATAAGIAETPGPVEPSRKDKCPVCGMFVTKYPDWVAEIIYDDLSVSFTDGAKDLFKLSFDLGRFVPGKSAKDIAALFVRDYYDMELVDARKAYFVTGSDVYGPMGRELIPLATEEDAKTFMKDHKGERILRFEEVTPSLVRGLD